MVYVGVRVVVNHTDLVEYQKSMVNKIDSKGLLYSSYCCCCRCRRRCGYHGFYPKQINIRKEIRNSRKITVEKRQTFVKYCIAVGSKATSTKNLLKSKMLPSSELHNYKLQVEQLQEKLQRRFASSRYRLFTSQIFMRLFHWIYLARRNGII